MTDIASGGGEASYHYEEIATIAKRRGLPARSDVEAHIPEAQAEFARNLEHLRSLTGLPMPVVSARRRRLRQPAARDARLEYLADAGFRRQVGVEAEAYDGDLDRQFTSKHSDVPYPQYWFPADPMAAIQRGDAPSSSSWSTRRHWHVDRFGNLRETPAGGRGRSHELATRTTASRMTRSSHSRTGPHGARSRSRSMSERAAEEAPEGPQAEGATASTRVLWLTSGYPWEGDRVGGSAFRRRPRRSGGSAPT